MNFLLFYFSGTGNTWWLVDQFAQRVENNGHGINIYSIEKIDSSYWYNIQKEWEQADMIGFAYPIYGSTAPQLMQQFVNNLSNNLVIPKDQIKRAFVFTTMELFSGDGALVLKKSLRKNNLTLHYAVNFQMISNLGIPIMTINPCSPSQFEKRLERTLNQLEKVFIELIAGKKYLQNQYNLIGYFFAGLQRLVIKPVEKSNWKFLGVNDERCNQCMLCVKSCPTQAISFSEGQFTFSKSCTSCYRCYNFCPTQAITVLNRTANPQRHRQHQLYVHKEYYSVKKKELSLAANK